MDYFVELFPITHAPLLTAYFVAPPDYGGRLAYHLRLRLAGGWVWARERLLTDTPPNPLDLVVALDALRDVLPALQDVSEDYGFRPDGHTLADFVVRGIVGELDAELRLALSKAGGGTLNNARVEREVRAGAWEVDGAPALSLSVGTRLVHEQDVAAYAGTLKSNRELVGLYVGDKTSGMRGEIVEVVGRLKKERERLLRLTARERMRDLLRYAPDDEPVVRVDTGRQRYDYAASALLLLVRPADGEKLGVDPRQAEGALRVKPAMRAALVRAASDVLKAQGVISGAFSTQNAPDRFTRPEVRPFLRYARGTRAFDLKKTPFESAQQGVYGRLERFNTEPIRAAVVNTTDEPTQDFIEAMGRRLKGDYGFDVDLARERKVKVLSASTLDSAMKVLVKEAPHVILVFMPDEEDEEDEEFHRGMARHFRHLALEKGLPCQVIYHRELHDPDAMPRLILGLLGKTGNLPFVLDEPPPYADYVAGIDFFGADARGDDDGQTVMSAVRLYRSDGALIRSQVTRAVTYADEPLPLALLAEPFPPGEFARLRVVLHREGHFSPAERELLARWGENCAVTFLPVEVTPAPRLYALDKRQILPAPYGTLFTLNARDAVLSVGAGAPLHVRSLAADALPVARAVESLQLFTLLHYGVERLPRLPVTLHRGEELGTLLAASITGGATPGGDDGVVPFWL